MSSPDPDAPTDVLPPGSLRAAVVATTERGLAAGTLDPLTTRVETVPDAGIPFSVRVLAGMERKIARTREQRRSGDNPFLPPDPDLYVGGLTASHCVVLNRFPVIEQHLLLLTRRFVRQEAALDAADFDAALRALAEGPGLVFYNGGRAAGSSQGHKHLQLVPLPADGSPLPMARSLADARSARELPFRNAVAHFREGDAGAAREAYEQVLGEAGLATEGDPRPYNLLLTRSWLVAVPRSRGRWEGIPTNALGYAGTLFARDAAQLERIREVGPLHVLRAAGLPW